MVNLIKHIMQVRWLKVLYTIYTCSFACGILVLYRENSLKGSAQLPKLNPLLSYVYVASSITVQHLVQLVPRLA